MWPMLSRRSTVLSVPSGVSGPATTIRDHSCPVPLIAAQPGRWLLAPPACRARKRMFIQDSASRIMKVVTLDSSARRCTNRRVIYFRGAQERDSPRTDLHIRSYGVRHVRSYADSRHAAGAQAPIASTSRVRGSALGRSRPGRRRGPGPATPSTWSGGPQPTPRVCSRSTAPDQAHDGGPVGEDAEDVGAPADLPVESLLRVVAPDLPGERGEGEQVRAGGIEVLGHRGSCPTTPRRWTAPARVSPLPPPVAGAAVSALLAARAVRGREHQPRRSSAPRRTSSPSPATGRGSPPPATASRTGRPPHCVVRPSRTPPSRPWSVLWRIYAVVVLRHDDTLTGEASYTACVDAAFGRRLGEGGALPRLRCTANVHFVSVVVVPGGATQPGDLSVSPPELVSGVRARPRQPQSGVHQTGSGPRPLGVS